MQYENPRLPEGINVSRANPLVEFLLLAIATVTTIVITVTILALIAEYLVVLIPYSREQSLVAKFSEPFADTVALDSAGEKRQAYLENLLTRLKVAQGIPAETVITVHYIDDDTLNAFATVGGHIFIHRGLFDKLHSENALAMVVAHELAHINKRDPIAAMARGITVSAALATLAGVTDSGIMERLFNYTGTTATMSFSREQETRADDLALRTVYQLYGHVRGAEEIFEVLTKLGDAKSPAFLSTHPVTEDRIKKIKSVAGRALGAKLTPLPGAKLESNAATPRPGYDTDPRRRSTPSGQSRRPPTSPLPNYSP